MSRAIGFLNGKAHYLRWDYQHKDVEVFNEGGLHLGSLDPVTKQLYKGPVVPRRMF